MLIKQPFIINFFNPFIPTRPKFFVTCNLRLHFFISHVFYPSGFCAWVILNAQEEMKHIYQLFPQYIHTTQKIIEEDRTGRKKGQEDGEEVVWNAVFWIWNGQGTGGPAVAVVHYTALCKIKPVKYFLRDKGGAPDAPFFSYFNLIHFVFLIIQYP